MNKLEILDQKAKRIVSRVSDEPEKRYELRADFYKKYGNSKINGKTGLGNSELAFIEWEIKRGILRPLNDVNPGSKWWREVNSHFIYLATLAALIKESGENFQDLPVPVRFWLDYINNPNECSWYRAHNSSIISGYRKAETLAFHENVYEQYFINIVLYRVLFAQSLVEGAGIGILGKFFAHPQGCAVRLITDIEAFYPSHYPLSQHDIRYVTHKAHNLTGSIEGVFDTILIVPHLNQLYSKASVWNSAPEVAALVKDNTPAYPIAEKEEHQKHFHEHLCIKEIHTI